MNYSETKKLLEKYDIKPTRSLGQNFLIDDRVVYDICEAAEVDGEDLVIEIGPGLGALTSALAEHAGMVTAIEIDRRMLPVIRDVLSEHENTRIILQDALKTDFSDIASSWPGRIKIAANLPYYITTELIVKLISSLPFAERMILMMQKEAAERIFAAPGSKLYGPASVLAHLYGDIRKIITVSPAAYYPQPHVSSVVIKLTRHETHDFNDFEWTAFTRFVEACFSQRRKTLANSLKQSGFSNFVSEKLEKYLSANGLKSDIRAEQLEPVHFLKLYCLNIYYMNDLNC